MELKASSQEPGHSPSISESNHGEKEISDDDDDDRNHKHRRRDDAISQSQEREAVEQVFTKPYKRGNKPPQNGHTHRESGSQFSESWKNYNFNPMDSKFDKRRPLGLFGGRGRGRDPGIWTQHDRASQMGPGLFGGRGLPAVPNAYGTSWGAFGLVPGLPNGGLDPLHSLGLQGAYRSINPSMNMGLGLTRQRCRDFEEQGFCLRGDMCPMEHGVNRIVVEDVQSLSEFNLPVSLQNSNISGGPGDLVSLPTSGTLINATKPSHGKFGTRGAGSNGSGNDAFTDSSGGVGADFYDPDQPLWGNDSQSLPPLPSINQSKMKESGPSFDLGPSVDLRVGPLDVSDEHVVKNGGTSMGRISSIKDKTEMRKNMGKLRQLKNKHNNANSSVKLPSESERNACKPAQKAQCTLYVNAIPLQQNNRETLLSHFNKFGEVINIHIPLNSEWAFVQFSNREEAEAALMAPDAVMGNRFIKLFWANRDNIPVNGTVSGNTVPPVAPRSMPVSSASHNDSTVPASDNPKPIINTLKPPPPSQKKLENLELLKKELRKKQEMLDQKRNDFRHKLDKLEKQATALKGEREPKQVAKKQKLGFVADSTKAETVLASPVAEVIGNGNKSLEPFVPQRSKSTAAVAPPEPLVLKSSPNQLPPLGPSFVTNRFKLDNRPTAFKIISTLPSDLANVVVLKEYFSQFGDLSKVDLDYLEPADSNNDPETGKYSAHVYFRNRHSAEKAFSSGKCWNGHNLQFSWLKSCNLGKDTESQSSTLKGNSDASVESLVIPKPGDVESENIEQMDIDKEQMGTNESNNAS